MVLAEALRLLGSLRSLLRRAHSSIPRRQIRVLAIMVSFQILVSFMVVEVDVMLLPRFQVRVPRFQWDAQRF